jgi:hypothetical protein
MASVGKEMLRMQPPLPPHWLCALHTNAAFPALSGAHRSLHSVENTPSTEFPCAQHALPSSQSLGRSHSKWTSCSAQVVAARQYDS